MSYDPYDQVEAARHAAAEEAVRHAAAEEAARLEAARLEAVAAEQREQEKRELAKTNQVCGRHNNPSPGGGPCALCIWEDHRAEQGYANSPLEVYPPPPEVYPPPPEVYVPPRDEGAQDTSERDDGEVQELPWVYVPPPDEGAREEKLEAKNICPVCSTKTPGGTRCQACLNNELLAFYHDSPEVFGQREFISDERDFMPPEEWIDMRDAPEGSARTAGDEGHKRNGRWFWNEMLKLHSEFFSEDNRKYIEARRAPMVDKQWLEYHGAHEMFEGDLLVHHHVDRGPMAAGVPEELHRIFHGPLHFV